MGCRGVFFALTAEEEARLVDEAESDEQLLAVVAEIEERGDRGWMIETDKAWDGIHRCLTDGKLDHGRTPLHRCILGKDNLIEDEPYLINWLEPDAVEEVASAIAAVDRDRMRQGYEAIDPAEYDGTISDEDFDYLWSNFEPLQGFFRKAADAGRAVIFTVDW